MQKWVGKLAGVKQSQVNLCDAMPCHTTYKGMEVQLIAFVSQH